METNFIPIFIGYDFRERAATNVLIDSLYQKSSIPLSITPLITKQLRNLKVYWRAKDPKQSTEFSFSRFLVPYLMNYEGWAIFMDCDMLCKEDISNLWNLRDENFSAMCVHHEHIPKEHTKFLGEPQTAYPKKNWSSLIMFNCPKCRALSLDYVNNSSGLDLHRFNWLKDEKEIGALDRSWNHLVDVYSNGDENSQKSSPKILHWTLGGPWFKEQKQITELSKEWFLARENSIELWNA